MIPIIPRVAHKVYTNTFLGVVVTRINYTATFDGNEYYEFKRFFEVHYNFTINKEQFSLIQYKKTLRFSGKDDNFKLKIGHGFIEISMDGDIYLSFKESISNHLTRFLKLLGSLNQKVSEISIEKVNFIPIQLISEKAYKEAINDVFSQPLIELLPAEYPADEFRYDYPIDQNEETKTLLSFGWIRDKKDKLNICLVVDGECISKNLEGLSLEETEKQVEEMNHILFDVFHWSVTDNIINLMN